MAKFLNTSAANYHLEELLKHANDRLIIISPYLRFNDRIKELLEDKNRMKIDVRVIYGKSELHPLELAWLNGLQFVRTSFCKNLHAKCYLSEDFCIISSMNLYEFSQVNNNEMGVLISRAEDQGIYRDAFDEAQRIIRISDEVRLELKEPEKVSPSDKKVQGGSESLPSTESRYDKLTTSKLAALKTISTKKLFTDLVKHGYLEERKEKQYLTEKGKKLWGELSFRRIWKRVFSLAKRFSIIVTDSVGSPMAKRFKI